MGRTVRVVCFLLALVAPAAAAQDAPLRVYAGIEPVRFLVDRVARAGVEISAVIDAGQSPETYEPTPRQIAALAEADVFFGVGLPLESEWRRQTEGVAVPGPEWVDLSAGLDDPDTSAGSSRHGHKDGDPHVWLSPLNAKRMASVISEVLGRRRPGRAAVYAANAAQLSRELDALHGEIRSILGASRVRAFLVFHPAWGHFARLYGLEQIAIESGGKEPGPRSLASVIQRAKQAGIHTVFLDPQHGARLAQTVAAAIGGDVRYLDPLAYDYLDNLRRVARAIAGSGT